ncbi:pilus assembly protein [Isoptericola sp. BMS4]|uniref:pilus assembly protein n=1 Tax=Isoptericola sp. BMS4 TaxID=2527875 RepID=UPI001F0EC707|nr:pilus assembly protein [Isoptericola sp. BMS4]
MSVDRATPPHGGTQDSPLPATTDEATDQTPGDETPNEAPDGEAGAALVEFLGTAVLLLVPLVYLVLTLAQVQAGTFAAEGAVREAGRALVTAEDSGTGLARAEAATGIALADQGFDDVPAADVLGVRCSADPCLSPGASVELRARLEVPLPFVPAALRDWVPLAVPVEASQVVTVDEYAVARP